MIVFNQKLEIKNQTLLYTNFGRSSQSIDQGFNFKMRYT